MNMKKLAGAAAVAFVITLAVIVGVRMSSEAMAVVIGVICGVVAGIPTSLIVVAVMRHQERKRHAEMARWGERPQQRPPSVIIVGGGDARRLLPPAQPSWRPPAYVEEERYQILGED